MRRIARTELTIARPREFVLHTVAVAVAGNCILLYAIARLLQAGSDPVPGDNPGVWLMLAIVVADGVHLGLTHRGIYIPGAMPSVAVTFALLLMHGWVIASLWQTAAIGLAAFLRREQWWRWFFVVGHYLLAFVLADGVLHLFGIDPQLGAARPLGARDLLPVTLAAVVFMAVVQGSGWWLRGSWTGMRAWTIAGQELRSRAAAYGAMLGIAPLIAVVYRANPWVLPLFTVPLYVLYRSTMVTFDRERDARLDPLTGLANRRMLMERGADALATASGRGRRVALCLLDLHRFHEVNDTLGHFAGDRLLQQVGTRLAGVVRHGGDLVARLGGDEFAVLLTDVDPAQGGGSTPHESALALARRIVEVLGEPFALDDLMLDIEASVGVAVFPDHARDVSGLLQYADVAMYLAKRARTGVELYDTARDLNTREKLLLLGELRRALDAGQVELHYQPKVSFNGGGVDGLEALVRWTHPVRGPVSPEEFVRLAEQTGLMPRLTRYVVNQALAQVARWRAEGIDVPVAVNVSARDVHAPSFADSVAAGLLRHNVPPRALQLEITERVLLEEPQRAAGALDALRRLGVRLSLDDFGTGYSSLVHLRHIPVSEIKIDRSFVARLIHDEEDAAIVRSTVDLAHSLGLRVVAEGVEDEETWDRLRDFGCDTAQGWLLSRALPREEATVWLRRHCTAVKAPGPAAPVVGDPRGGARHAGRPRRGPRVIAE